MENRSMYFVICGSCGRTVNEDFLVVEPTRTERGLCAVCATEGPLRESLLARNDVFAPVAVAGN